MASLENYSSFSNVSVFTRAGSRYETYDEQGLTHLLRNCAFLVSKINSVCSDNKKFPVGEFRGGGGEGMGKIYNF